MQRGRYGKLDSVSLGGIAVFGALAVVLTTLSQALVLSFPLIPYLQFDLGEVAILLAFFIFGPIPAIVSSFIEFGTLMVVGQNVAFFGPELKLMAILSSLVGIWLGTRLVSRMTRSTIGRAVGTGAVFGMIFRAVVMTIPNYLLIVLLFGLDGQYGIIAFVSGPFKLVGITITDANALAFILGLTAVFNALQLLLVSSVSYLVIRLPQVQGTRPAGRRPWIVGYLQHSPSPPTPASSSPSIVSQKASP
jgi:riboflavin transporter FmnP